MMFFPHKVMCIQSYTLPITDVIVFYGHSVGSLLAVCWNEWNEGKRFMVATARKQLRESTPIIAYPGRSTYSFL